MAALHVHVGWPELDVILVRMAEQLTIRRRGGGDGDDFTKGTSPGSTVSENS